MSNSWTSVLIAHSFFYLIALMIEKIAAQAESTVHMLNWAQAESTVHMAQAESTVHMLNWAIRSVKFLGVEFD